MKILVSKCPYCGDLFENKGKYEKHMDKEAAIKMIEKKFPNVVDTGCRFANGEYYFQRDKKFYEGYKKLVIKTIKKFEGIDNFEPLTYGWYRCLDDGDSIFYGVALRILNICDKCYKEYGQSYFKNNCCQ